MEKITFEPAPLSLIKTSWTKNLQQQSLEIQNGLGFWLQQENIGVVLMNFFRLIHSNKPAVHFCINIKTVNVSIREIVVTLLLSELISMILNGKNISTYLDFAH